MSLRASIRSLLASRLALEWLLALAFSCAIVLGATASGVMDRIDYRIQDWALALAADKPDPRILLVTIDDQAVSTEGAWPWPRQRQADLLAAVAKGRPRTVVLDILYLEPTTASDDQALTATIAAAGNVVLPHSFGPMSGSVDGREPLLPIAPFAKAARRVGHSELYFDEDGAVRRMPLAISDHGHSYPHLAVAGAAVAGVQDGQWRKAQQPLLIPFHEEGGFPSISASALLAGEISPAFLKDRIVLIGVTAQGLGDRYVVPRHAGSVQPGVLINAETLDAILKDGFVTPVGATFSQAFSLLLVLVLFLGFWLVAPRYTLRFALVLMAVVLLGALVLPSLFGIWYPPAAALLAMLLAYPLWAWRRLVNVVAYIQREARELREAGASQLPLRSGGFDPVERQMHRFHDLVSAMRERFDLLRTAIQAAPEPIVLFDTSERILIANSRAESLFGQELNGLTFPDLIAISGAEIDDDGEELHFPDGRRFQQARGRFDDDADSRLREVLQLHEITDIRLAEQQRREMLEFLSHDMRSPQSSILLLARERRLPYDDSERLRLIAGEAERTLALADTFVQLARLDSIDLDLAMLDLGDLVSEAVDRIRPWAGQHGLQIQVEIPARPVIIAADRALLERVVENLVGNAIKYCPADSTIAVAVGPDPSKPEHCLLTIADDGPGLPDSRRADPFARFGASEGAGRSGAGLGLAFVADVVEKTGGTIAVETAPGEGTAFRLSFPKAGTEL